MSHDGSSSIDPQSFALFGVRPDILAGLCELGFETPTPVQEWVIPALLSGQKDLVGLAQTGTGKTAAFGIPLIQRTHTALGVLLIVGRATRSRR